jgi:serine/threonine protein phosphatase PrpC
MVMRRIEMETFSGVLLAVADGHGGAATSAYVALELAEGLFDKMLADCRNSNAALRKSFQYLNDTTLELSKRSGVHSESGTTLSIVYVPDREGISHVGIIGDSPVIHARKNGYVHLFPEHNIRSNVDEKKAAEERGGVFMDGYLCSTSTSFGLQLSSDIGCHAMGNILRRDPEICDLTIDNGDYMIIGSDGLFDPTHSRTQDEARRISKLVLEGAEAQDLVNDALSRRTEDNVTAIVYIR